MRVEIDAGKVDGLQVGNAALLQRTDQAFHGCAVQLRICLLFDIILACDAFGGGLGYYGGSYWNNYRYPGTVVIIGDGVAGRNKTYSKRPTRSTAIVNLLSFILHLDQQPDRPIRKLNFPQIV